MKNDASFMSLPSQVTNDYTCFTSFMRIGTNYFGIALNIIGLILSIGLPIIIIPAIFSKSMGWQEWAGVGMLLVLLVAGRSTCKMLLLSTTTTDIIPEEKSITCSFLIKKKTTFFADDIKGYYKVYYMAASTWKGVEIILKDDSSVLFSEYFLESLEFLEWFLEINNVTVLGKKVPFL